MGTTAPNPVARNMVVNFYSKVLQRGKQILEL